MIFYDFFRRIVLPLDFIDKQLPVKGNIYDLGCGNGLTSRYLARKRTRDVLGIDKDAQRLPRFKTRNLKFTIADLRQCKFQNADGVLISDVLHHMPLKDQKLTLSNIKKTLNPKGTLIIKEIDKNEFLRSKLSRLWDLLFYPKDSIYYWHADLLVKFLKGLDFKVSVERKNRLFPGSTTLYICKND